MNAIQSMRLGSIFCYYNWQGECELSFDMKNTNIWKEGLMWRTTMRRLSEGWRIWKEK